MEIKVGDKVRVSKDAQEIFVYGLNPLWFIEESTVVGTHPDGVLIKLDANNHLTTGLAIPTKYLIKVDAEAKEAKLRFKEYDTARVKKDCESYNELIEIMAVDESDKSSTYLGDDGEWYADADLEPYAEPTEEKIDISAPESVEYLRIASEESHLRNLSQNIADCDKWDAYTANLARDLALKVANKYSDPTKAADYAVSVAKAVVENLKKK